MRVLLLVIFVVYAQMSVYCTTSVEEKEFCLKRDGSEGLCTHFLDCSAAIEEVAKRGHPEICGFEGIYPIVCCSKTPTGEDLQLSKSLELNEQDNSNLVSFTPFDENNLSLRKCRDIYQNVKYPKIPAHAFIGGRNSPAKEYPYMALLGFGESNNILWQCGGSLISLEFVLTAAHCLSSRNGDLKYVRLGELDLSTTTDDADPQDFTVKQTYPHPNYTSVSKYHDIALVKLDKPARLTDYVRPACLPLTEVPSELTPLGMGWGLTSVGGETAKILQTGYLAFKSYEDCRKVYGTAFDYKEGILEEFQVCADGGGEIRDTCQGDSGGPLELINSDYEFNYFPEIVGIISFGKSCGKVAGVYTKVKAYIPWIENIVWPNS